MIQKLKETGPFLKNVIGELKRVSWPSRKELVSYTLTVMVTIAIVSLYFAIADLGISYVIQLILGK